MSERLAALHASVAHLGDVVTAIDPGQHTAPAYPTQWSIADTMSHIGSGAVILNHMLTCTLDAAPTVEGFNQSVWDEWNAKAPRDQVADALVVDRALLDALESTTSEQRANFAIAFGPMELDFDRFVGLRLGEHVLHTWDVEVALDPDAVLAVPAAGLLLDQVHVVVGRSAQPTGHVRRITVRTHEPTRDFFVVLDESSVTLLDGEHVGPVDVELPAESFVRLIYGRLDAEGDLDDGADSHLELLRRVFPGF